MVQHGKLSLQARMGLLQYEASPPDTPQSLFQPDMRTPPANPDHLE